MNIELLKAYNKVLNNKSIIKDDNRNKVWVLGAGPFKNETHLLGLGHFKFFKSSANGKLGSLDGPAWIGFDAEPCIIEYWIDNHFYTKDRWELRRKQIVEQGQY